jgi:DNA recombination protein RmuC
MEFGMIIVAVAVFCATLGIVIGVGLGWYVWRSPAQARMQAEIAVRDQECRSLRGNIQELNAARAAADQQARSAERENAALRERERHLNQRLATQAQELAAMQERLTTEFENIATRILKSNTDQLSVHSEKSITDVIKPLQDKIKDFQDKLDKNNNDGTQQLGELKGIIQTALASTQQVASQADSLAKALRGDSQILGRWGELALERILQAAGLTEGREYFAQGKELNELSPNFGDGRDQAAAV